MSTSDSDTEPDPSPVPRSITVVGAERIVAAAAAALPPPCGGGYSRGSNLRACMPLRDSTSTHHNRYEEEVEKAMRQMCGLE
ncbi:uncharacterized protein A4U43_C01F31120 [Asparagus officinalis]|uniref:Uncharacterized protein n=1 Tax=Asparagus officinalis TaxID=4686 RepID=A0A5P1FUG0_ASPOF|nr:uncharacterized protein A4U43_C01F31120 [Asparagus officinalis]